MGPTVEGFHANGQFSKQLLPGDLAVTDASNFDRTLDRFAIADLRLVKLDLQVEVAQQAVHDHFQVQFAHPGNDRLARLLTVKEL